MKRIFTEKELPGIAKEILKQLLTLRLSTHRKAQVVALSGELGAGKTTLTQEIARQLGIKENVNSPTYVIMKKYKIPLMIPGFRLLIHIDAYRLDSEQELEKLGWQEIIAEPENLILIEWPVRVKKLIPKDAVRISLEHKDQSRSIRIT
ncbi:tRNA (adenosine(37)-N6)-threonylcarbamoyltransferase complex ATPase subunit type 1 TsaE [Candidatus Nomurabacteria bacterium]|jgi:tRNA threonylcarbamoyladenosine biosynthesis protein TsaE|nr:MAG: tRNA (adenosine(37)-N6)-threonylcarbamoyltransferase complex ATPase subunit type 1 TsaE [Candidatus Nomurabacteria bacterium]